MCFVTDRGQLREEFTFPHLPFTFTCTIDIYHLLKPSAFSIYLVTLCTEWKLLTVNTRNVPNTAQVFSEQHAWESKQQSIQCTLMAQEEIAVQQKATVFWQGSNALLINWQYNTSRPSYIWHYSADITLIYFTWLLSVPFGRKVWVAKNMVLKFI